MAFQTYQFGSSNMPLLEELKGETVLSLAQRSPKQLSDLCIARGLNSQGTVHEIAARLVDWKKAVGHGPAPATPTLEDSEFDCLEQPSFDPRVQWPEDEESIIGLGHLSLTSPSRPSEMGLVKNSELTTPSSTPSTSYHSIAAQVDPHDNTKVEEETFDFTKFQSPHPKRGSSPRQTPPTNPNAVIYPRPPNIPISPLQPGGPPRRRPSEPSNYIRPPIGINSPHQGPYPKTPHPCPNRPIQNGADLANRSPLNHPLNPQANLQMNPQINPKMQSPIKPQIHYQPSHPINPTHQQSRPTNNHTNQQPNLFANHPLNRKPSPKQRAEPSGETLFQSLLGAPQGESLPSEHTPLGLPNPAPEKDLPFGSFVGIEDAVCLEPITVTTDWAATPEPSPKPKQYDPTKPLAKDQLEEFLLQGPGQDLVQIKFSDLEFGRKLGSGGYKECYAGTFKGEPVAIGELKVTEFTPADFQEIKNEIDVLKQLWHENVVRFIGVTKGPSKLSIVTELCHRGDLYDHMRKTPKPPLQRQLGLMHDISLGVSYLHTRRPSIIHRDLKSMNILVSRLKPAWLISLSSMMNTKPKSMTLAWRVFALVLSLWLTPSAAPPTGKHPKCGKRNPVTPRRSTCTL
ncbi:hypothetical protein DSO57_1012724 [Entomophthora muscae]|uniref:Uncharacterized protein n=1 Tax=Entomophthora muscae TaxID=34485 RepID=A0ACC2T5U2_9FUNG|nr:hypothetical protein DSO57_1012724 [Entomophthora muscae]